MSDIITISSDNEDCTDATLKKSCSSKDLMPNEDQNGNEAHSFENDVNSLSGFRQFLKFCADFDVNRRNGCPETMSIIEKKILSKYEEADPDYLKSEAFKNIVVLARQKIESDPSRLFVHLKELSDELKLRKAKKKNKRKKVNGAEHGDEPETKRTKEEDVLSEESNCDNEVNKRHVKKLELIFEKVYRRVKKLEKKEVDWDEDEENSNFIKWSRYSKRLYSIWEKWQEAKGSLEAAKRLKSKKIAFAGTSYPKLNHAIESFVNKSQKFPDFHDILKLTTETLNDDKKLLADDLNRIASSAFQCLGNQLQKSRIFEFWNSMSTYLPPKVDVDPATIDDTLAKKLQENQKKGEEKLNEVVKQYVDQQVSQNLEPEEVPPNVDDEDYKSEGEEDEGESDEEKEQEDPEVIIAISSSSDESETEGTRNPEEKPNDFQNGDFGESTNLETGVINKTIKEEDNVKEEKLDSAVEDDVLPAIKVESATEETCSIASTSFITKKSEVESSDDDVVEISD